MKLSEFVKESDLKDIPSPVRARLEAAVNGEIDRRMSEFSASEEKKFAGLIESVTRKFNEKVTAAVMESVKKTTDTSMNDKMCSVLKDVASVLESANIPATEATKRYQQELEKCNAMLRDAYRQRELVKQKLNNEEKINTIYALTKGMKPGVIDSVIQRFKDADPREVDKDTICAFISGNSNEIKTMDVNPELNGKLDMDNVNAALKEIDGDFDPMNLGLDRDPQEQGKSRSPVRFEAIAKGLDAPSVMSSPDTDLDELSDDASCDADVRKGIAECEAFGNFGGAGFI